VKRKNEQPEEHSVCSLQGWIWIQTGSSVYHWCTCSSRKRPVISRSTPQSVEGSPPDMMEQLLLTVCEQAECSDIPVRAAALMHIARVVARSDQTAAERLLERGIALAKEIDGDASSLLLCNAISLAAAVSAKHALPLYAEHRRMDPFGGPVVSLVNVMAQHGHLDDAITYLREPLPGDRFPLHLVNDLDRECHDDETRRQLLELAIREWRNPAPRSAGPEERFAGMSFTALFGRYWNLLPREVAAAVLRELVDWALDMKSEPTEYTLTENLENPKLGSEQEFQLFRLIPALQHLEPDLAHSLLEARPQLAAAVKRFPLGMRSVWDGQSKYDSACDDLVEIGDSELMPIIEALSTDFEAAFRDADESFAKDTDAEYPNVAHKECWPSAREFRHILFKAGQHQGRAAAKYLDRIPDADLRLFAQIELCAGIAGLPQLAGLTTQYPSKPRIHSPVELDRIFGSVLPDIRCPRCEWTPRTKNLWCCKCGHHWNTFDTRGLCPVCEYQWEITGCLLCGVASPHQEWYVEK
jgi:hypothetical protein